MDYKLDKLLQKVTGGILYEVTEPDEGDERHEPIILTFAMPQGDFIYLKVSGDSFCGLTIIEVGTENG